MEILTFSLVTHGKVSETWDGLTYAFDFRCLPKDKIGKPDQNGYMKFFNITVKITGTLVAISNLSNANLIKVLYFYACEAIKREPLNNKQVVLLHTNNTPSRCPYDPKLIKFPNPGPEESEPGVGVIVA